MNKPRAEMIQELVQQVMLLGRYWRHSSHAAVGPERLSPPQAHIVFVLAHNREMSVKELADKFGITPGAVTQFANELVRRGLVVRENDPNDRRVVRLSITDAARAQAEQLKNDFVGSMAAIFQPLDDEDLKKLVEILAKLPPPAAAGAGCCKA